MSAILLIPPSAEPWSVAEAKTFLRVEHDDDDAVIAALIAAARGHVEALSRRALLVQRWRFVLDAWPANGRLDPRIGPLRSVIAARVFDAAGNAHSIDVATFVVDAAANIIASPCWALPLQKLPREPMMVTTAREMFSAGAAPPPTIAPAGVAMSAKARTRRRR